MRRMQTPGTPPAVKKSPRKSPSSMAPCAAWSSAAMEPSPEYSPTMPLTMKVLGLDWSTPPAARQLATFHFDDQSRPGLPPSTKVATTWQWPGGTRWPFTTGPLGLYAVSERMPISSNFFNLLQRTDGADRRRCGCSSFRPTGTAASSCGTRPGPTRGSPLPPKTAAASPW